MTWQKLYEKFGLFDKKEEEEGSLRRRSNEKDGTGEEVMEAVSHRIL